MVAFLLPGVLGYNLSNGLATGARAGGASCLLAILQSLMFLDIIHISASLHAYESTLFPWIVFAVDCDFPHGASSTAFQNSLYELLQYRYYC